MELQGGGAAQWRHPRPGGGLILVWSQAGIPCTNGSTPEKPSQSLLLLALTLATLLALLARPALPTRQLPVSAGAVAVQPWPVLGARTLPLISADRKRAQRLHGAELRSQHALQLLLGAVGDLEPWNHDHGVA